MAQSYSGDPMAVKSQTDEMQKTYQFGEFFSQKDAEGIKNILHENCALFDPALKWVHGRDKIIEVLKEGFKASKFVNYDVIEAFQDREVTIARFEIQMDAKKYIGVDFMRWEEGQMKELICYYNPN